MSNGTEPDYYKAEAYGVGLDQNPLSRSATADFRSEVLSVNNYHKEGLLTDFGNGRAWWLVSDEGKYMGGTELGPAPLMYWLVGMEATISAAIAEQMRDRKISCSSIEVLLRQDYGFSGSFSKGDAAGFPGPLTVKVSLNCDAPQELQDEILALVIRETRVFDPVEKTVHSNFSLYANGRAVNLPGITQGADRAKDDPFLRHTTKPGPAVTKNQMNKQTTSPLLQRRTAGTLNPHVPEGHEFDERTWFSLTSAGVYDFAQQVVRSVSELSGSRSRRWEFLSDPAGHKAPTPFGLLSIGVAFCFHTQLARFAKVRRMDLEQPRLLQDSSLLTENQSFETHVFVNGHQGEEAASSLVKVAMNTCYAHKSLNADLKVVTNIREDKS